MIIKKNTLVCFGTMLFLINPTIGSSGTQQHLDPQDKLNEGREYGEVVTIKGKERPDLVQYFDDLKKQTTMVKGKVYVKEQIDNEEKEPINIQLSADIVSKAQQSILKAQRTQLARNTKQSQECQCEHCGVTGVQHGNNTCPAHGAYPSCQACGGCLSGGNP